MVKNPPAIAGDTGNLSSVPVSGITTRVGNGYPLQYSGLEIGQRRLAGYSPWYHKKLDTTE